MDKFRRVSNRYNSTIKMSKTVINIDGITDEIIENSQNLLDEVYDKLLEAYENVLPRYRNRLDLPKKYILQNNILFSLYVELKKIIF